MFLFFIVISMKFSCFFAEFSVTAPHLSYVPGERAYIPSEKRAGSGGYSELYGGQGLRPGGPDHRKCATVRAAAGHFGISKSTVHKDITQRLPDCNRSLYLEVKRVLDRNKAERHLRGGEATRMKYKGS